MPGLRNKKVMQNRRWSPFTEELLSPLQQIPRFVPGAMKMGVLRVYTPSDSPLTRCWKTFDQPGGSPDTELVPSPWVR